MNTDLVLWIASTLAGTCVGLLHVALGIRALRRSVLAGLASLLLPLAAPVVAHRTGARKVAIAYVVFLSTYSILLLSSV